MSHVNIDLHSGIFDGCIRIHSSSSKVTVARVARKGSGADPNIYPEVLRHPGVYMLLVNHNQIYVGQTSDSIAVRIQKPHKGELPPHELDRLWHTVIAFAIQDDYCHDQILKYLENMLCEYVHSNVHYKCITSSPTKESCTKKFRKENYTAVLQECAVYEETIKNYLDLFPKGLFMPTNETLPSSPAHPSNETSISLHRIADSPSSNWHEFVYTGQNGLSGKVLIEIENGRSKKAQLQAGSIISANISDSCLRNARNKRSEAENNGTVINRVVQVPIDCDSANEAIQFLTGNSKSAPASWKSAVNGKKLEEFLQSQI